MIAVPEDCLLTELRNLKLILLSVKLPLHCSGSVRRGVRRERG